ncbi:GGDEF domain-containing protein [Thermodesulforhabdus norvegica]|uniref:diguanylate cyclase n=1 Tax=Thermodesulforhabdus norvegica TaxID=39841 RepID=A0A1I4W833_9BACT|nr:diguanylate cyclase [Thermodesulforhabdus norvegica]SFN09366.1 response regulator receiver modulated diguanylate cyclase [Thermodesulforhabdus norvegica]
MPELFVSNAEYGVYAKERPPLRILVVDDDENIRKLLLDHLTRKGYHVRTASDGMEAIRMFSDTPFDIVITDMHMPGLDGLELIRRIKSVPRNVDIVAITGYIRNYRYADIVRAGAADFLIKPFGIEELDAKIERIARDREERAQMAELLLKDALTGAYNRYALSFMLKREIIRSIRYLQPLSLLFSDIDRFKQYNDTFGHLAGDVLLEKAVRIMDESVRKDVDFVFRFGGDEFIILLTNTEQKAAEDVARRIIKKFKKLTPGHVGLSVGIAVLLPECKKLENKSEEALMHLLLQEADKALYEAKRSPENWFLKVLACNNKS